MPAAGTPIPRKYCRTHSASARAINPVHGKAGSGYGDTDAAIDRWVVKTLDQDRRKVFINVCGSSRVSLPSSWQHGKVRCVGWLHVPSSRRAVALSWRVITMHTQPSE